MNPVGSVLSLEELQRIADICLSNNVMLCSDEIHCDIILDENVKHIPAGKLAGFKGQAITLMGCQQNF